MLPVAAHVEDVEIWCIRGGRTKCIGSYCILLPTWKHGRRGGLLERGVGDSASSSDCLLGSSLVRVANCRPYVGEVGSCRRRRRRDRLEICLSITKIGCGLLMG